MYAGRYNICRHFYESDSERIPRSLLRGSSLQFYPFAKHLTTVIRDELKE